ncbi:hypothetical protein PAEPH01_2773 [Pancytospora epiphaga]|nr:hypothetical protein PAEPH01_2773 [Pancytospora epiphaga]
MIGEKFSDISLQRPGSRDGVLYGRYYLLTDISYMDFCKALADSEDPRTYVCPGNEDFSLEKPELESIVKKHQPEYHDDKPQDSYAYMIYRALECSPEGKLTLSEIYKWVETVYPFYKTADPVWKNSIRHNLSLNTVFKKIPRPETSKGKGGYWAIDYESQNSGKSLKRKRIIRPEELNVTSIISEKNGKLIF